MDVNSLPGAAKGWLASAAVGGGGASSGDAAAAAPLGGAPAGDDGPVLYADLMSQPSRAVWIFCRLNNLPVKLRLVRIDRGEHRSAWFKEINPLAKLPFLTDGPLRLPESAAILLYLAERFPAAVAPHWVPRWPPAPQAPGGPGAAAAVARLPAIAAAARLSAALHWQGSALRGGAQRLVLNRAIGRVVGYPMDAAVAREAQGALKAALGDLERFWLRGGTGGAGSSAGGGSGGGGGFMAGPAISVADVLAACEIEQLALLDANPSAGPGMAQLLAPFPGVRAWLERVRRACQPAWGEAHATLAAAAARMAKAAAAAAAPPAAKL